MHRRVNGLNERNRGLVDKSGGKQAHKVQA
jgi:hypothetical protein